MPHITSVWAGFYDAPDPAPIAAEITSACADIPRNAARLLNSVTLAMRFSIGSARTALAAVQAGWSARQPHDSVRAIWTISDTVEISCHALSQSCTDLAAAVSKAHAEVRAEYSLADSFIDSSGIRDDPSLYDIDGMRHVGTERIALVARLCARFSAVSRALDADAARMCAQLAVDPGTAVPYPEHNPSRTRHEANTARLRSDLRNPTGRQGLFAAHINEALSQARDKGYTAQLLSYEPNCPIGQGGVAIAIGNVSSASSVSVLVPGVGNSPVDIAGSFDLANELNAATESAAGINSSAATVLWLGYDLPLSWPSDGAMNTPRASVNGAIHDSVRAIDATSALMGGVLLTTFVHSLRPLVNGAANLTLIGHSYGSTTVSQAARSLAKSDGVDAIVLLASPGAGYGITTADDYKGIDADQVFSLSFPLDPVPKIGHSTVISGLNPVTQAARKMAFGVDLGPFGPNPADASFRANVMNAPSNAPDGGSLDFDQHALTNYLSGESLAAVGAVTAGRYGHVPVHPPK
ncbi:MAG: alpha/beta hydrolase [Nakamurella sp.]